MRKRYKVTVKLCGMTCLEDVELCQSFGADILGFVVDYPVPVPWNLTPDKAETLMAAVHATCRACVVTGGCAGKTIALARRLRPALVQLHGDETLEDVRAVARALPGVGVVKAFPPSRQARLRQFGTADADAVTAALCEAGVAAILVDSRAPDNAAQPGTPVDAGLFAAVKRASAKPVILAGGITPENVRELLRETGAAWIDILTGVETDGAKDPAKIRELLERAKDS